MPRGKASIPLDLPRPPGLSDDTRSKQECIAEAIRDAILNRLLAGDTALPSTRTLAERWRVARGTVEGAFDRLCSEGYIVRTRGSGTRVSAVVPDTYLASSEQAQRAPVHERKDTVVASRERPYPAAENAAQAGVPFIARLADPDLLRMRSWRKHAGIGLTRATPADLSSTLPQGDGQLREQIAEYLRKFRGIPCGADDVFITTGIRNSIDLIARAVLRPGNAVLIEDPGYSSAQRIFELAGAATIDIPVDREGIETAALPRRSDVAAAYVTPAHQSPLGVTMSVSRRLELLEWASQSHAWIIEDDYDGEFSYQAAPLPALKSLDVHDRVVYCGSFNKTLFSGLRVGFMVLPAELRVPVATIWRVTGRSVAVAEQLALASFISSGDFAKHLRASRHAYLQRRNSVLQQLARYGNDRYAISGEHAGFHFMLWLANGVDDRAFVARAAQAGVALQPLSAFTRKAVLSSGVVVGYTALTIAQALHAGKTLGHLLAHTGDCDDA
ncbi:PLP-dependent aminotransferase family protein [Trinickia terrae]|uniref:PLP-dependent aminotransferase family protein n=1 Tax=Trinickia terrae TaxID=2571161 RepID=A0A4U1IFH0_9BURK|nr:PLP-dependent aminotransferase family protein [Trinickia terrae]TKC92427.1 PLP-dependent aminotransferase family protein [Trinickia terrae]